MIRKTCLIMCVVIVFLLGACGKREEDPKKLVFGNGGIQINIDSINVPGGESDDEETELKVGKEKPDTITIVVDWDKIMVSDKECNNIEEMRDQIVKSGCKKIDLQHTDASKNTLDEVIDALKEIEESLEIDINYN